MSIRYRVELILDPAFTSRAYRARQLICGQYASWAAEMHMADVFMTDFFQCSEPSLDGLMQRLAEVAKQSQRDAPGFSLERQRVEVVPLEGHVYLGFASTKGQDPIQVLHRNIVSALAEPPGVAAELRLDDDFSPRLPLMEFANLPQPVFADAAEFSSALVADLQVPSAATAWRLMLLRYISDAAGEDWTQGRWAADLRWEALASNSL